MGQMDIAMRVQIQDSRAEVSALRTGTPTPCGALRNEFGLCPYAK
jgi:hypothetical protein